MADEEKQNDLETDVQPENGCTDIANELVEALLQVKWTESEWAILWLVFRLSYGILIGKEKRKSATFPEWSDAYKAAGIAKQNFYIALFRLIWKRVLVVDWETKTLAFNKYYEYWRCPLRSGVSLGKMTELISYNLQGHSPMTHVIDQLPASFHNDAWVIGQLRQGHSPMTQTAKRVIGELRGQALDSSKNKHPQRRKPSSLNQDKPRLNQEGGDGIILSQEEVRQGLRDQMYFQDNSKRILGFTDRQMENAIKGYGIQCCIESLENLSQTATRREQQGNPIDDLVAYFFGICKRKMADNGGRRY